VKNAWKLLCAVTALCLSLGCEPPKGPLDDAKPFINNYATLVHTNYSEALTKAEALKTAVDAFVASPSASSLNAAKQAWLAAREPYGQSEVYRFYNGPIDNEQGPEGRINAWPLDEAFIDYVEGEDDAGIINDVAGFPTLTKVVISTENEQGGEENISTGYHAIEFLLWGQDHDDDGPGNRPHTDYVTGAGGTAANQARRGQYLKLVAELLVDDLRSVTSAWAPGATNYASDFRALDPKDALGRILQGMGGLSGAELSGERMTTAYDNKDQEDEHSCFSDNTHRDLYLNALAIQNVYLGRYGSTDGIGLDEAVRTRNPDLDTKMKQRLDASLAAVQAIPPPFDQAIQGEDDEPGRVKVIAAVRALQAQTETIVEIAGALGIQINLE
jgi:putative iron-regulated protein